MLEQRLFDHFVGLISHHFFIHGLVPHELWGSQWLVYRLWETLFFERAFRVREVHEGSWSPYWSIKNVSKPR